MTSLFLDSSVLAFAAGDESPAREPSRRILRRAVDGQVSLHASVEAIQEFVHHRMRRGDSAAVSRGRELSRLVTVHPFDRRVLDFALELAESGAARGREAVHAATALLAGFDAIVSTDKDFNTVPGLTRIDPVELVDEGNAD